MFKKIQKKLKLSDETMNFVKTTFVVAICFGVLYLSFLGLGALGMFEKGYDKPETKTTDFTYNTALMGMVFNRPETEYYVLFDENEANSYLNSIESLYKGELQIYKVDMSLGVNSKYMSKYGNSKAKNSSELAIKSPTLIKIKNGKIVNYIEDIGSIEKELSN